MSNSGEIVIRLKGFSESGPLTPYSYDISELKSLLQIMESLIDSFYPKDSKRPPVSYEIKRGSVLNIFRTSKQISVSVLAIASMIGSANSLEGVEYKTAKAFQELQKSAVTKGYTYEISDSENSSPVLRVTPTSNFKVRDSIWVDTEVYLYGSLENAGGSSKSNVHIRTKEYGLVIVDTDRDMLKERKENFLYRNFAIRAASRVDVSTGQLDLTHVKMIDMTPFDPIYDENYLDNLIDKAGRNWKEIEDVDLWLNEMRGYYG